MAKVLYQGNDTDVVISPVRNRATGQIETGIVFSCTLYDPNGDPVAGATALLTTFEATSLANVQTILGSLSLTPGAYSLNAVGTGAFANRISFQNVAVNVRVRNG